MILQRNYARGNGSKNKRLKGNGAVVQKSSGFIKNGLQARPAALFVQEANRFHADIFIEKMGRQ